MTEDSDPEWEPPTYVPAADSDEKSVRNTRSNAPSPPPTPSPLYNGSA